MVNKSLRAVAALCLPVLLAPYVVHADVVTLYIPDTPPVAISADILGTDGAGRTTWRLSPGQPSGSLSSAYFPVATMVEGPNDVHASVEKDGFTGFEDCTIKDGVAVCHGVLSASGASGVTTVSTTTETVTAAAFAVQITGVPKNGAGGLRAVGGSTALGVAGMLMGVVYGLGF